MTSATKLAIVDRDFTKFSLTPSVSFLVNIPVKDGVVSEKLGQ